jgi:hypothetical protein
MSADNRHRGPRRPKHIVLAELEQRVLRGKNQATLDAIKALDRTYSAFGKVVLAANGEPRACEAIDKSDVGAAIVGLRVQLVALLPEAIQPKPVLHFEEA